MFTTGGAENPILAIGTLAIVTLAIRQADYISVEMSKQSLQRVPAWFAPLGSLAPGWAPETPATHGIRRKRQEPIPIPNPAEPEPRACS